ncbi:hypothetical protein F7018_14915 [Tenacibaculum aiptasiae]|uniref:DUF3471 domain-containing protein n=1 Tax=Tenacibaculum aiptasiae TaxID=426481 RepID=A0A7J5AAQ4_9FLAO|nr:hypothetical protein [Tenacibaculum aiptasiae]KAB1154259.1 hypothetical protein F7018_14915 [Tenacibaculum aiptasiae]
MKKKINLTIILLCLSNSIFSQNTGAIIDDLKKLRDTLVNHTPKYLKNTSSYKLDNNDLEKDQFQSINGLRFLSYDRETFSENEKKWLKTRIEDLATALFLDNRKILLSQINGLFSDPTLIENIYLNRQNIINIKLLHTCTDAYLDEYLLKTFNTKMYSLMKVQPPDGDTKFFIGEYRGIKKNKNIKLFITKDRELIFWSNKEKESNSYIKGLWKNIDDTLFINLENKKTMLFKFNNKKNKLIEVGNNKSRFKKIE